MANALAHESSPYLLQHKDNPVDWLPWGEAAFERAREQDKPLLISIGYSACHWCHVMERESFEDEQTAALMNEHFVCVKVDREERPDIDAIYMEAVQAMTGHGGWPLNVFIAPDQTPFYGGTYFPPQRRHGLPSWGDVLYSLATAWTQQREEIRANGEELSARLARSAALSPVGATPAKHALDDAVRNLAGSYDELHGGFGTTPKFPPSCVLGYLLTQAVSESAWSDQARSMTLETLRKMAIGGIHDQVGGGFSRYAVDRTWTVPHFEKMLYDNALLLSAYTHGYQLSGEPMLRDTATGIADWALRELRGPEGAFMSALDADSDGVEGLFYTWTEPELQAALGDLYETATRWLTPGSFEGRIVLEARGDFDALTLAERQTVRQRLLGARSTRVRPQTDTKRLTAWNGLMIGALARAGSAFERPDFTDAAQLAARFVLTSMRTPEGHLLRSSDGERAKLNGYLEDHAFLLEGLLGLYEATFDPDWFGAAREIADAMIVRFGDDQNGGFFSTSSDHEQLLTRRKDLEDNPIPSGNSSAALGLLRLAALTGDYSYEERAAGVFALVGDVAPRNAHAFGHLLTALDFHLLPTQEVALAGDDVAALAAVVRHHFRPHVVLAGPPGDGVPLMQGRTPVAGQAAAYVCERFACLQPMTDADALSAALH